MKTIKYIFFAAGLAIFAAACSPMDDNHLKFVEDGPITYLTKLTPNDISIAGERNKVVVELSKMVDPRVKEVKVYWANKTEGIPSLPVNPNGVTSFMIDNLDEGTYVFEFILYDDEGNKSLTTAVTAVVYGQVYEAYLMPRPIMTYKDTLSTWEVTFAELRDTTLIETILEWSDNGVAKSYIHSDTTKKLIMPSNFNAYSFRYYSIYRPGKTDLFRSANSYMIFPPEPDDVVYDRDTKVFTFPDFSSDDNWLGGEMYWIDRIALDDRSFSKKDRTNVYTISSYQSASFKYYSLFKYDDLEIFSAGKEKSTSTQDTISRSLWYLPYETRVDDGSPFPNVMNGPDGGAANATAIAKKNKSPYLSQKLPNATSAPDGLNNPRAHIDGNYDTFLSMVKGPGTSFAQDPPNPTYHANGGVDSRDVGFGNEIYFIIDRDHTGSAILDPFDQFRIYYRTSNNTVGLKPQMISLFGSDDPACIDDQSKWENIRLNISLLPSSNIAHTTGNHTNANASTGNIALGELRNYRYIKCRYEEWLSGSNSIQISEFFLIGTVY
jgi:hypothetical protein